jgi:SAM-dependent methyltransferase
MISKEEVSSDVLEYHQTVISRFPGYGMHFPSRRHLWADVQYRFEEFNTILKYFTVPSPAKVLDVGTGYGQVMYLFHKKGYEVCGLDDDFNGTRSESHEDGHFPFAEKKYCGLEKEDLPYAENTFDLVTCLNTIEHIPCSPRKLLKEIHRVLKNGGVAYISQPNVAVLGRRLSFFVKGKSPYWDIKDFFETEPGYFTGHSREYTRRELLYMIGSVGFKIIDSGYYDLEYYKWIARCHELGMMRRVIERLFFRPIRRVLPPLQSQAFVVASK